MKHFKKIESKFLFSLLIMSVWSIIAVGQTTAKISKYIPEIEKWIQKQFAKGKTPPFSFICDGKPSAEFIRQWDYSQQKIESEEADVIKYLFTYYNPTNGLKVECTVKGYPSYQAAEWVLNFTNKGTSNSPTLEQVKVVDLAMQYASKGEFKLTISPNMISIHVRLLWQRVKPNRCLHKEDALQKGTIFLSSTLNHLPDRESY